MDRELLTLSKRISALFKGKGLKLKIAESFTGGAVSGAIVSLAGASEYFDECIVCYSNSSKQKRLGVKKENLDVFSAVSLPTVRDMLVGLIESGADVAVATTGYAGGECAGECYIGAGCPARMIIKRFVFKSGGESAREKNIAMGTREALKAIIEIAESQIY